MIEREMEDLLAGYPDEFFPRQSFVVKGRQQSFAGVGRFDLLFEDHFHTTILMELKARPAKYEDATQLAKYKDELEHRGDEKVLMWLVAPNIPKSVCDFLERIAIQYSEIHFVEFRRAAQRHGIPLPSESEIPAIAPKIAPAAARGFSSGRLSSTKVETGPRVTAQAPLRWEVLGRDLMLQNPDAFDQAKLAALVDGFQQSVPSRKNAHPVADLGNWAANPRSAWGLGSCSSLLRWVTTSGWKDAVPAAEAIWEYMFGRPAPTWYVWDRSRRRYDFDAQGWRVWYESLPH